MAIPFSTLDKKLKEALVFHNIKEENLFNYYGDLYVGCSNLTQASKILNAGVWRGMSSTFKPLKGSEMEKYPIAVDIGLGAINWYIEQKLKKKNYVRTKNI